ncbi:MAG: transposase, partial [Microcystis sp. Msp_OC_L_20101000_S702]
KWKLIRGLYEKEFEREQIIKLFEIIDNMMTLSPELQSSLESKIKQFEEERTMPLMSNMELRGMERGKEIGKEIGALENARNYVKTVLKMRLGDIPIEIEQAVDKISVLSILDELLKSALTVNSFDELHQLLEQ